MQRRLDAVESAVVAEGVFHFVPVATRFAIAAVAGTSYVAAAADADVAIAVADAAIAASACAGAGYAFAGDASATRREADCPARRERYLDDRQQPPEVCN